MEQDAKPTLHEIAAMPFPHSQSAMRRFYNKDWGKPCDGELRTWKVKIDYSYRVDETEIFEVLAASVEEAEEKAAEEFDKTCGEEDADIRDVEAKEA